MMELTINGQIYQFTFGMGFLKRINKTVIKEVEGVKGQSKEMGFAWHLSNLFEDDLESLITILVYANEGHIPRITSKILEDYIDEDTTDIDALKESVIDFLERANATRKMTEKIKKVIEKQEAQDN